MSMRKFAQSVSEDLNIVDAEIQKIVNSLSIIEDVPTLQADPKLQKLCNNAQDVMFKFEIEIEDMLDSLQEYAKPQMRKDDLWENLDVPGYFEDTY